jgi:hypothetical protein
LPALLLALLAAGVVTPPHLRAVPAINPPVIDGHLDDPAWQTAVPSDTFTQYAPTDGASPSERTIVRILYDDEALYVGVLCEQTSTPIIGHLVRRDADSESDGVGIFLDSRGEGKDAFWMSVNVAGTQADGTVHDQNVLSTEWDENWEVATSSESRSWSAEFRIPFRALRFPPRPVQSWGLQVIRYIAARQEVEQWAHVPRDNVNWVANYGRLDDLRGVQRSNLVELRPYVGVRLLRRDAGGDTLGRGYTWLPSAGIDLRLHLRESLTLDAAIAPDFTQVEADQIILNLSNYETFLPEKRALFLEGADLFATPLQDPLLFGSSDVFPNRTFYSRRVGSAPVPPTMRQDATTSEQLLEPPSPSTIYAAAKLIGTVGNGWSIGALSALTARNDVAVEDTNSGARSLRLVDPATIVNVLRLKRNLGLGGQVGIIATGVTRFESRETYPTTTPTTQLCPSGALVAIGSRCFRDAYVAATDGLWRSPGGEYLVAAQVTGSLMENGPALVAPDGTIVKSGDTGAGGWVRVAREGGKHLLVLGEYSGSTPTLDYNDAGYMARANLHEARATLAYRTLDPGNLLLESYSAIGAIARWSFGGLNLGSTYEVTSRLRFTSFWIGTATIDVSPRRFDDREIGDGVALERAASTSARLDVTTDPRRAVVVSASGQAIQLEGARGGAGQLSILAHALPQLDLEIDPQVSYTAGEIRFAPRATASGGDYIFGRLRAGSASVILRAAYSFTPHLTLQAYSQLFVAAGHYSELSSFPRGAAPGATIRLAQLVPGATAGANPDFEQEALNVNVVFRWEYRLGSTLYLVYSRAQAPNVILDPGEPASLHLAAVLQSPAVDVLLVKVSFWWTR